MSYGSVEGVAAIASTWTKGGIFLDADLTYNIKATNPPLATVEAWLITMSAYMDAALMDSFFITPLTNDFPVSLQFSDDQVNLLVADLVASRNNQGRFFVQTDTGGRTTVDWSKIQAEIIKNVNANVQMFLKEGVPQITANEINYGQRAVILKDDEFI